MLSTGPSTIYWHALQLIDPITIVCVHEQQVKFLSAVSYDVSHAISAAKCDTSVSTARKRSSAASVASDFSNHDWLVSAANCSTVFLILLLQCYHQLKSLLAARSFHKGSSSFQS